STRRARLRPDATGRRTYGFGTPRSSKVSAAVPRRAYSVPSTPFSPPAVVLRPFHQLLQADHDVDRLDVARRGHAEEVLDVDDADAAQLHVMAQQVVRIA